MNYNWDWSVFFKSTGIGSEIYLDWFISGLGWTIAVALVAWIFALIVGSVLGVMRTLPNKALPPSEPPRLGIALEDATQGLTISTVTAGSLAEKTGLRAGDRIVEIAGRAASGSSEAVAITRRQPPGTWLPLRIARGDSQLDLVVQFPPRP